MAQLAHRVKHITKTGAAETLRVFGQPDRDMAAMLVASLGGKVISVEAVDADAPRVWGELSL